MAELDFKLTVGGDVQASQGTYLPRPADDQLLTACLNGEFSYVLACRQIGKSSLKHAVTEKLLACGVRVALIDLNSIGGKNISVAEWYFSFLDQLDRRLNLHTDVEAWWNNQASLLSSTQRLLRYFEDVMLKKIGESIVIFVDEIDVTLGLPFTDDFFAAIRFAYTERAQHSAYRRVTFVLLGVASPDELINDQDRTPFNIGHAIPIRDFTLTECHSLQIAIEIKHPGKGDRYFEQIYSWTNGHPYLTQRLCKEVVGTPPSDDPMLIDELVSTVFLTKLEHSDENLRFLQARVLGDHDAAEMLDIYKQLLLGESVPDDERSRPINRLKLYGLAISDQDKLEIRNRIYRYAFDQYWVEANMPMHFVAGGILPEDSGAYVKRVSDDDLLDALGAGELCCVLAPRQMGKSSLMEHVARKLRQEGTPCVIIDLGRLSQASGAVESNTFIGRVQKFLKTLREVVRYRGSLGNIRASMLYAPLANEIQHQLTAFVGMTSVEYSVSERSSLLNLFRKIAMGVEDRIVFFVDEVDIVSDSDSANDLFASLLQVYVKRDEHPELVRFSFVLLGYALKSDILRGVDRDILRSVRDVSLTDFREPEASLLREGLERAIGRQGEKIFTRIYHWTDGHPYLTQRLCQVVVDNKESFTWTEESVDQLVKTLFAEKRTQSADINIDHIQKVFRKHPKRQQMLQVYSDVYQGKYVMDDSQSIIHEHIKLTGLVKERSGRLGVRNRVYQQVFDQEWIRSLLKVHRVEATNVTLEWMLVTLIGMMVISVLSSQFGVPTAISYPAQFIALIPFLVFFMRTLWYSRRIRRIKNAKM